MRKTVIFDLDGTLALIDTRRKVSTKPNGKIDWGVFHDPVNISLDKPNWPVIQIFQSMKTSGFNVVILSGRSDATKDVTIDWLNKHEIFYDKLVMRNSTNKDTKYMPDDKLKLGWFNKYFPNKSDVLCVFDDRNKVVQMWRDNDIPCMQVADANF